ncbi:MetQ/NlpA family ABC transporter substrate-binding protein [Priestia megaterium]|uniref:MetQ/NlpA family ABC transporter substrate-binding protein n=1 Tax=Priestia megaterium TaxID=1404 RepID=UPI0023647249|nr:MetQ/NlpA family ABC transporter substrate-binding protein [Priestia megaterium]MDD1513106.1 MetQ/NlpA family ABC transporter substrate-binding protein [Priestia megaterium]
MNNKLVRILIVILIIFAVAGCSKPDSAATSEKTQIINIGVTSGPFEKIANKLKEVAKNKGITVKVTTFNDYILPNQALVQGKIDVNVYQTSQFLEQYNKDHKTNITAIAKAYTSSQAIYSEKYNDIKDIPKNATVGIPNDPINLWRGLLIYQSAGLITLKPDTNSKATIKDIKENPKNLKFKELEAGMLAPTLKNLDAAIIPSNYALQNGYNPKKDALFLEDSDKFATFAAVTPKNKDNKQIKKLVKLYGSKEMKAYIKKHYDGVYNPVDNPFDLTEEAVKQ